MSAIKEQNNAAAVTPDHEIVITRVFDAPREMIWEAFTDPKKQRMRKRNKKSAGPLTGLRKTQRKAAQPLPLGRLACVTGMEVDDLAPQFLRRPPRFRRMEVCRNVEFNQFRHHVLLAGNPTPPFGALAKPAQKPGPVQSWVSLFPHSVSCFSKLSATSKNTTTQVEFLPACAKTLKFGKAMCALAKRKTQLLSRRWDGARI
jgi:hypothetical protein